MKIACLLTPMDDHNLTLASQVGVEEIVSVFPGRNLSDLLQIRERVDRHRMELTTIERFVPHHKAVHRLPGFETEIETIQILIANMAQAGLKTLCYNWMPSEDWNRTDLKLPERGGALVTGFDLSRKSFVPHGSSVEAHHEPTGASDLWENLKLFQEDIVPVAEEYGINLALHPDDPPLGEINGQPQILSHPDDLERAVDLVPSERNGICFCQGTFASRGGIDIPAAVSQLAPHIKFIHFRDVIGELPAFRESFHDNGKTDMAACWRAYEAAGLDEIAIRPDHVPTMAGESNEFPGYEMQGRLFAVGYMKGLQDSV